MKTFKVVFLKIKKVIPMQNQPVQMAEQTITTDESEVNVIIPEGYQIMTVCEILEPVTIIKHQA
jgi:hypothetical protein